MKVTVTSSIDKFSSHAHDSVQALLRSSLARFAPKITQVSVLVADENGPRGGVDKLCQVNVMMPGIGTVTTTARHEKLIAAVSAATRRDPRIVVNKTKRRSRCVHAEGQGRPNGSKSTICKTLDFSHETAETVTIVYPDEACSAEGKLSILSPLGSELLGRRIGESVTLHLLQRESRKRVEKVTFQPERVGAFNL